MTSRTSSRRLGFTLSQLVTVGAVFLFLLGLLFPAVLKTREAASRSTCQNNLKQIGVALNNYASANGATSGGYLCPLMDYTGQKPMWHPFWYSLYPYMEQDALYRRGLNSEGGWDNNNHNAVIKYLLCPSDTTHNAGLCKSGAADWAGTSYAPLHTLFGAQKVYQPDLGVYRSIGKYTLGNIPDGTANQFCVVERLVSFPSYDWGNALLYPMDHTYFGFNNCGSLYGAWGLRSPQVNAIANGQANPYRPNSAHVMCQVVRLDGSVASINGNIDEKKTWFYLCTPDDGNVVTENY